MKNRNILISGASIAGPALAYWLRRYGFNPTVVERAPAPRKGGQAIDLRGAGRDAAERMGIMADIRRAHTGTRGVVFLNSAGRRAVSWPADLLGDSGGMIAEIEILRADLVQILYSATRDDVEYVFDDSITGLEQGDGGVKVTFERGAPRAFDLVVGADGLHSNVRKLAFGAESEFVSDLGYYMAIFATTPPLDLEGWQLMYSMPGKSQVGGRMASLYPTRNNTEARGMFFFASPPLPYDRRDIGQQKKLVADAFAGEAWEIPRVVESMWEAPDFYFDRASKVRLDSWSRGRAVLLGDSAFGGSVGMGTSMAMVGAYVLAGELAVAEGNHRTAFARYEHELRDYVEQNQKPMPGGLRGFLPRTRGAIWLRNQFMRMMLALPWRGLLTGGMQETANALTLKDYPHAGDSRSR
jgi:2-polyprenyl-6-methoxyphenol hydroxylase-like FAD-dependent oxidoreductase